MSNRPRQQPWEARAWVALLQAQHVCIYVRGERFMIDQSNGVRQGSPDSSIAFGRIVARELDKSLSDASDLKPATGEPPPKIVVATWTTPISGRPVPCIFRLCLGDYTRTSRPKASASTPSKQKSLTIKVGDMSSRSANKGLIAKGPNM